MFAIQRYLIPLELLSGIVIVGVVESVAKVGIRRRVRPVAIAAITILLLATTRSQGWGRLPWGDDWFAVSLPAELSRQDEMFVVLSGDPVSYVIPSFPRDARFVRLGGNLSLVAGTQLFEEVQVAIASHRGPLASLGPSPITADDTPLLARFGLRPAGGLCLVVRTRVGELYSCPVARIDEAVPSLGQAP